MCSDRIDGICRMNLLPDLAERYILSCREARAGGRTKERFANMAGFCRFCGIGFYELSELKSAYPDVYSALCLIFEDEALNSDLSPTLLASYLKRHLDFSEKDKELSEINAGELRLVFEHDIEKDGE